MNAVVILLATAVVAVNAALPDYIPICKRNDPQLEDCILRAVDKLRPMIEKGMPELEVPALNPLKIPEVVISPTGSTYRIVARDLTVKGAEGFRPFRLNADVERNTFYIGLEFPSVTFEGHYDANIPTPIMRIKGAGPVRGNATNIRANAVLEGKVVKRDGQSFYNFKTLDLDVKVGDYKVRLEGLFGENRILEDVVLNVINDRSREFAWMVEPLAERAATGLLLNYANRIAKTLPLEEMFPIA